jgi:hypothetical protein
MRWIGRPGRLKDNRISQVSASISKSGYRGLCKRSTASLGKNNRSHMDRSRATRKKFWKRKKRMRMMMRPMTRRYQGFVDPLVPNRKAHSSHSTRLRSRSASLLSSQIMRHPRQWNPHHHPDYLRHLDPTTSRRTSRGQRRLFLLYRLLECL